jgi:alpha-amylase/alpha-mannosidase (GH57 family)
MLNLVLCWHMHQPDYRHRGQYLRPWTWLHAIKDYSDMAAHLEDNPSARAVVNFSPVLILQLQDLADRVGRHVQTGELVGDTILDALAGQQSDGEARRDLTRSLMRVNEDKVKLRFEPYSRLHDRAREALAANQSLSDEELNEFLTWYVLVWMGESVRDLPIVSALQTKAHGFTIEDRKALLACIGELIGDLLPRYRKLAENDRIELSVTPHSHPILPLLLDLQVADQAMSGVKLPATNYPGGSDRCDWQMTEAIRVFEQTFGFRPAGCWPSEGGLSDATVELLQRHGFRWTASGSGVLNNSLSEPVDHAQLHAWNIQSTHAHQDEAGIKLFFRDDALSDRIGFEYSKWDAAAAADDFVEQLEHRLDGWLSSPRGEKPPVLSMIMDGENAWEYFPENGHAFLQCFYQKLVEHPRIRLTTYSELSDDIQPESLPGLVAGSWVYGTFSTWIGDAAKNRAWELLIAAKVAVDAALEPVLEKATQNQQPLPEWVDGVCQQLAVCEASDWFWWLGEDNQLEDGPAFDSLFRQQLAELYELIGMRPPDDLDQAVNDVIHRNPDQQQSAQAGGAMRPATESAGE